MAIARMNVLMASSFFQFRIVLYDLVKEAHSREALINRLSTVILSHADVSFI